MMLELESNDHDVREPLITRHTNQHHLRGPGPFIKAFYDVYQDQGPSPETQCRVSTHQTANKREHVSDKSGSLTKFRVDNRQTRADSSQAWAAWHARPPEDQRGHWMEWANQTVDGRQQTADSRQQTIHGRQQIADSKQQTEGTVVERQGTYHRQGRRGKKEVRGSKWGTKAADGFL
jgi:hypothetical protein